MIRFELERRDPVAIRVALAACRSPLRIERGVGTTVIVVREDDAERARRLWLRAGLEPRPASAWPAARALAGGILDVDGTRRCVARVPIDRAPRRGDLVLALAPIPTPDAIRAIVRALDTRMPRPFRRGSRRLARVAATLVAGEDGVAAARAFAVALESEARLAFASAGATRLRAGALAAWHDIEAPRAGVWRSLASLQHWWVT